MHSSIWGKLVDNEIRRPTISFICPPSRAEPSYTARYVIMEPLQVLSAASVDHNDDTVVEDANESYDVGSHNNNNHVDPPAQIIDHLSVSTN